MESLHSLTLLFRRERLTAPRALHAVTVNAPDLPHFGHGVLSAAWTFSRLIFCLVTIGPEKPIMFRLVFAYIRQEVQLAGPLVKSN